MCVHFELLNWGVFYVCRHVGDLGNIAEADGVAFEMKIDSVISLQSGDNGYIIDRSIVVSIGNCNIFFSILSSLYNAVFCHEMPALQNCPTRASNTF